MKTSRSLGAITLALICTIGGTNLFALKSLHESTLRAAEGNLNRYSLMLAENANRSFKSLDQPRSAFAQERSRNVRLPPAREPGSAAREERCAADRKRLSRAA